MCSHNLLKERAGVNAVEAAFLKFGWVFRELHVGDYGIDAWVEIAERDVPIGQLFALQIKSGPSYFKKKGSNYVYRGSARHLTYWTGYALPIVLVLYNPEDGMIIWQKIDREKVEVIDNGTWSIEIPCDQTLDAASKPYLRHMIPRDIGAVRRLRLTLDIPLMKLVDAQDTYMTVEHWLNKGLAMRNPRMWFGPERKPSDCDWEEMNWMPTPDVAEYMGDRFPWLDYEYTDPVDEIGCEVEIHHLLVTINDIGRSALRLDEFYLEGYEMEDAPEPPTDVEMDLRYFVYRSGGAD